MTRIRPSHARQRGQILVLFTLAAVAAIAMVGLVLDGSDTFAQRRDEQNAADMAALAGANAYLNVYSLSPGTASAKVLLATAAANAAATATAAQNGYLDGVEGATVSVNTRLLSTGAETQVGITKPHTNNFARIVGFSSWPVSVDAAAQSGSIDTAIAAAPWLMHIDAFNPDGSPKYGPDNPQSFGEVNGDYPVGALDLSWTDFNGSNNVNTDEVDDIINGENTVTATFSLENGGQYIGQKNEGNHTALYTDVNSELAGKEVPIPIVGDCPGGVPSEGGCFKGWALFRVISADGGACKCITGYFVPDGFQRYPMTVGECTPAQQAANQCGFVEVNFSGAYTVRLVD